MARIRTLDFLPEIFQTPSNREFLAATLDQIVNPPSTMRIQGYIGSKFGYGINATDDYVIEPTKTRTDYQLDPAVVFTKKDESIAQDFISYPGIIDALKLKGAQTNNNSRLFESQFYSWDSFTDLDKLINYNQYYWLPDGPPAVTVATDIVYSSQDYVVTDLPIGYNIAPVGTLSGAINPTLTLIRGGVYTFAVNQDSQFWIQGEPGVTGFSLTQPNLNTREVYGVTNNGASQGLVTFVVPSKNAQDEFNFPYNMNVDLVCDIPFDQVDGQRLADLVNGIDGVTGLNGLTVLFYNTGIANETGYISAYYNETDYDTNLGLVAPITATVGSCDATSFTLTSDTTDLFYAVDPITGALIFAQPTITFDNPSFGGINPGQVYFVNNIISSTQFTISERLGGPDVVLTPGTGAMTANINQGLYEEGYYTSVRQNFYQVQYVGDPNDPILRLIPSGLVPSDTKITPLYGTAFVGLGFYKALNGEISKIPYISAPLDILYYQDGTSANKVGIIRLIEGNVNNTLNVETEILGKKNFTSTNGVVFTNGLKVEFDGDVIPASYLEGEYYVEGVGTAIKLIPVTDLVCPEDFSSSVQNPFDVAPYDVGNYDANLFIPVEKDYITIARASINKNAWSRSNRWFHIDVINATATYNNNPSIATEFGAYENKALRPIIEFYPNLKLFNTGSLGKDPVDFYDTRQADALSLIPGTKAYYPDVETYTSYTATIAPAIAATSTTITVDANQVVGSFQIGMYIGDTDAILPDNAQVVSVTGTSVLTITVGWENPATFLGATNVSVVGTDASLNNYQVFSGSRIIFSKDTTSGTKNKIFVVELAEIEAGQGEVITLSLAEDADVLANEQVVITRGYNNQGKTFYYDGLDWLEAQLKLTVNQPPLFDIFDANGISFGDFEIYNSTTFKGCKLFSYGVSDSTIDDPILGFPVRYSTIDNVGDISFDVNLNLDTFNYVAIGNPITQQVNTGYVYNYDTRTTYNRLLGWETAVAPSTQYQVFSFPYNNISAPTEFTCDVAMLPPLSEEELGWPRIQVFYNNIYQTPENYSVSVSSNSTTVTLLTLPELQDTVIQILLLSDQTSENAYYTIPINLSNNPLNDDLTSVNIGDIRMQYRDIFINAPTTSGEIFGPNNYRDLGNLVPYGTQIIQNSASLVLPAAFLRKREHDLFNALLYNSREYIQFKQLIVDTVQNSDYEQRYTPSEILDAALDQITAAKSQLSAFFWSDMLPSRSPFRTNVYTFANSLDTSIYPLTKIYNFDTANYDGVLVYLSRTVEGLTFQKQLLFGVDYIVSSDSPSLTITLDLLPGDQITIKEYNQTYGSFVPNTPTKLGLYQAFEPAVVLDTNYNQPTYFIKGHDGSYTKLYGQYIPELGILVDFRDQALLEFEKRIYNNLKLSTEVPIRDYEVLPGYFRDSTYSWEEFLEMYSSGFLNWVGQNRLDYKTQFFNKLNEWTYNYTNSQNKLDRQPILQGYWRGLYQYLYDTTTPEQTPWEMLGFAEQPSWWEERYGPAPYTSDNEILWGDIEAGYIWNNGEPYIVAELSRPGLSQLLPVNSAGELLTPFVSVVANYNPSTFQKDWKIGDMGPVELSYRRSSSWPFDVIRLFALTRPAEFFNLAVDLDNYKYSPEFNQYLVNNRSHLVVNDIEIYGNGIAKTSYINWIVDFEKQLGITATENINTLLDNLDVRLAYRLAGFSDKTLLKFYVEKGSPNSNNASLLIPDESYQILLYDNQPYDQLVFTGIVVQRTPNGWSVYGNGQNFAYFNTLQPVYSSGQYTIEVPGASVKVTVDYSTEEILVPYGTVFYTYQEVSQFILSYAAYLKSKGMIFDSIEAGREINWELMVQEFLYWIQLGWDVGSVITLNPAAATLKINKESTVVQPLTVQQQNFILNQDLYPIQINSLSVYRDDTEFTVEPLNTGDSLSYGQFNLSNFEHGIVFNNTTLFNDTIYKLVTGLRQDRITVTGTKTAEWNGTVNAYGFILNQDNVQEWSKNVKYTKGQIVKYKNRYYSALNIIEPSLIFDELQWALIDYENIQKGMLPNASTRAYESTLYYNVNKANLEQDADLLSYSLIGYRPRDYLALVDLTDITQINVYKNIIRNKGTRNATLAFKGANLPQGGIDYDVYENWAIQSGSYGGLLNENFVEFRINQNYMTANPSIVSLTDGEYTPGSNQEIPLYSLFNYQRPINNPNILSTTTLSNPNPLYPNAGYVNFDDVEMAAYYFAGLPTAVDSSGITVPINEFYVRDYMWLANFKEKWAVYSWKPIGQVVRVVGNLNGTATVTFAQPHNLQRLDPLAIINFASNVDGYYIVTDVLGLNDVVINLAIANATNNAIQGFGIGLSFVNQRVSTPAEIKNLDLLEAEFTKNTVWVDENTDGEWAVYRKSINYLNQGEIEFDNSVSFGSAVAYTQNMGYLVSDPGAGKLYRYSYDAENTEYTLVETVTEGTTFGTKIVYANDVYVVSEPLSGSPAVYIYTLNDSVLSDDIVSYQVINAPVGVTNWGSELAISDDSNWIYISDLTSGKVYVYRKQNINLSAGYFVAGQTYVITDIGDTDWASIGATYYDGKAGYIFQATGSGSGTGIAMQITYELSNIIDGSVLGLTSADGFAKSLATNQRGDLLVVGAPNKNFSNVILDWGVAYAYQRTTQNVESQFNSLPDQPQTFQLAWTPNSISYTVSSTTSPNTIELNDVTGISENDPIIFTGVGMGGTDISTGKVYYVSGTPDTLNNTIELKTSRSSNSSIAVASKASISGVTATTQVSPLYVNVNGILVDDSNYACVGSLFYYTGVLQAGDIVSISDNQFNLVQTFNSDYVDRTNIQFGYDLEVNKQGSDILVGSPFEIDNKNREGAVYRYTNGGARHGIAIGTTDCNVVGNRNLLINGFLVQLTPGDASHIAAIINSNQITNIRAASVNGKLIIQTINNDLTIFNEKLVITAFDGSTLDELGLQLFTKTQIITCPHEQGPTQFGSAIKMNDAGSVVISAPVGTRYEGTTFDFTDDENLDNDTVFDNNATRFVDSYPNAGAVYMFDFLGQNNESLINPGAYIYAQSTNSSSLDYGFNPGYGLSLDFNDSTVLVGSPNYQPVLLGGQVVVYNNSTGIKDWSIFRQSAPIVDIEKIQNTQIFSAETNNTLINLDYMDPLNGKLLGAVRENIDYVSSVDPAKYNSDLAPITGQVWGAGHVGQIWFNTSNVRFMNYHQNDPVYNAKYWGSLFPGSDVAVYTWVASNVPPNNYFGAGIPLDVNLYSVSSILNASGLAVPVYYFWVRNSNIISQKLGKTLSDTVIASYIANPKSSGIAYMAPILPNAFALYNCSPYINANDSVFHIGFANGTSDDVAHNEFTLIRENYPDDFLPGLPSTTVKVNSTNANLVQSLGKTSSPYGLYDRMLDSLSGCDESGQVVPNPYLPKAVQSGILARPRQSFFYNRFAALNNYLLYANTVLAQYPITETRPNATFLFTSGEYFNTPDYWEYVNWWAPGYDNNTKSTLQVSVYADLAELNVPVGTIVTVEQNGAGKFEVYRLDTDILPIWTRIGLENGTIRFKSSLWDYDAAKLGYSGDFFDTTSYDLYPSEETRYIIRALNEQIYIDELLEFRNKSLVLLFEYIQSETTESQNYLPWLSKTSLIDVSHTIRELLPLENLKTDNQEFLEAYINEVKPYHVVVKDFLFKYTRTDVFQGDITDFDLPAQYNSEFQQFISPQLVYSAPTNEYQYAEDDPIWEEYEYSNWFANRGVEIAPQPNYEITTLQSYVSPGSTYIIVDNAYGFPINGVITLGSEQIAYSYVDKALNIVGGLLRGINGTTVTTHLPGESVYIDLPAVVLLDGGRGYSEPPKVTAYIDTSLYPEPIVPAQLEAVMSVDSVLQINVIDAGQGYAVLPEIRIDPASSITFNGTNIDNLLHTINVYAPNLRTGDIVQYKDSPAIGTVNKLQNNQWYYIGVLESDPGSIIALYTNYADALQDHDRIEISSDGTGIGMTLNSGARASAITSASPIRENNITLRFDRTSYTSQVTDWETGKYYGSFFAGNYFNSEKVASSSILLDSELPDINTILASAQGVGFEIVEVDNDRQLSWSSFVRNVAETIDAGSSLPNEDRYLVRLAFDSAEPNASGSTIGFYVGMPIKFTGFTVGGLVPDTTYYVAKVINESDFSISTTENGNIFALFNANVGLQTLNCYSGEVVDTAILTVNYPGILNVTASQAQTNILTVPISEIGTGGTAGFYTNLPVFFTGDVFGGIVENDPYYITTVIDNQTFTISKKENPLTVEVTETVSSTSTIVMESTTGFNVNDAVIFTGNTFGNVVAGVVYYVRQIISDTELTLSTAINGSLFTLSDDTGIMYAVNQKDTVNLTTATGSMTMNVSLPVSPGQVNGQLFTLYNTSVQYPNINNGEIGNLIERTVSATLNSTTSGDEFNRVALSDASGGTNDFYVNMPIRVSTTIGGLSNATTYYVSEYSGETIPDPLNPGQFITRPNLEVLVVNTTSSGGEGVLTCSTVDTTTPTESLYVGMPIVFSGSGLGGIEIGQRYYVEQIDSATQFRITDSVGGTAINLETDNGSMRGTGEPYIALVDTPGGTEITVTDQVAAGIITLNQFYTVTPVFDVSYILGGYRVVIENGGAGFAIDNTITISGTEVGGTSPTNNILLLVNSIDEYGAITDVIISGTVPSTPSQYYLKVISENQFAVYSDPLMQVPVSGINFGFVGFSTTTVLETQPGPSSYIVVSDSSQFELNDAVVFTGEVEGGLISGNTYYVVDITGNDIQVSNEPGGTPVTLTLANPASFTMAKAGSFAFLPEPFYFSPSIVKHLGRVWICVISNNDEEFVIGKWEELRSSDRILNALDRTIGYYQPTVNMPGVDLTQLFEGVIYPNPIYQGNAFEPDQQFPLDVELQDQPFYPTEINLSAIAYDNEKYIAPANLPNYSAVVGSIDNENWTIGKLTNAGIGITDIIYTGDYYVMTSTNSATPIIKSIDGIEWSVNGLYIPYEPSIFEPDILLNSAALALNAAGYQDGIYLVAGENILRSTDAYVWSQVTNFNPAYDYQIFDISFIETQAFTGFAAVGKGKMPDYSTGLTELVDTNLIFYSNNSGLLWNQVNTLTTNGLYGLASNGTVAVAVGEEGAIYYTENGANWLGVTESSIISVNGSTDQINVTSAIGLAVNDTIVFNTTFSTITAGTVYYVKTIDSPTQITISETLGGATKNITSASIPPQSLVKLYDSTDPTPATLRNVIYANGVWIAVGDNGTIKTSTNYLNWTVRVTNTVENLTGITYNSDEASFTVVGENNTIITSADNGVTWTSTSLFAVEDPIYNVQGSPFDYGYGPEELVPGIVTDDLAMIVTTKPGSTWPVVEYGHTGFNTVTVELQPTSAEQVQYSFNGVVQVPTQILVQVIDNATGLAYTLNNSEYSVDWVNKIVILDTPLAFSPVDTLLLTVYEAGNGNQLVKSSTDVDPIRENSQTGFNEIYLNCNYSAPAFEGSGVIQPGTEIVTVLATATDGIYNRITLETIEGFALNQPVVFQGATFGNIVEDTTYYVKSISTATNSITVSETYNIISGLAGPTFSLTTDTGSMYATINFGNELVWADPLVYHNGTKLVLGNLGLVKKTSSINNALTTTSTFNLVSDQRIVFCDCIFDPNLSPMTTYYVKDIIDSTEFTISATPGGPVITLSDSVGGARFITNDFAFSMQEASSQAKIVFATDSYENGQDYIVYSILGELSPTSYGYSSIETQEFIGDGTTVEFNLDNYVGGSNPENTIVEIDGLRISPADYAITFATNSITFSSAPASDQIISVASYNETAQQYLTTQIGTDETLIVSEIIFVNNAITSPIAQTIATTTTTGTNQITVLDTTDFVIDQPVEFKGDPAFGGINNGQIYFVESIVNSTTFTIKDANGTQVSLTTDSGTMVVTVGGNPTVTVTTANPTGFALNTKVRIDGVSGSTQLNNNVYYVRPVTDTVFELYQQEYQTGLNDTNYPIMNVSSYTGGGYIWEQGILYLKSSVATSTSSVFNRITVDSTENLVENTPVYFSKSGEENGTDILGGINQGTKYFVKTIYGETEFSISETQYGAEFVLTTDANDVNVTQWNQTNPDRLYVTVNGYRVPSSKLRINEYNEVSILHPLDTTVDEIIITNMIPTATPNQEVYINFVNQLGEATVYRGNSKNRTHLTQPVYDLSTQIYVADINSVVDQIVQHETVSPAVDGYYNFGLSAIRSLILSVTVVNNSTGSTIDPENYSVSIENLTPTLKIKAGAYISVGDSLTITTLEGGTIFVNGEQINFGTVDLVNNSLGQLQRGANGTAKQFLIPEYTTVYGLLGENKLRDAYYGQTWNSYVYNTTEGDPLQISITTPALFLRSDANE